MAKLNDRMATFENNHALDRVKKTTALSIDSGWSTGEVSLDFSTTRGQSVTLSVTDFRAMVNRVEAIIAHCEKQMEDEASKVISPHWLVLFKRTFVSMHSTRALAEDAIIETHNISAHLIKKLRTSMVIKIPRVGIAEIVYCDCTDCKHTEELRG